MAGQNNYGYHKKVLQNGTARPKKMHPIFEPEKSLRVQPKKSVESQNLP